LARNILTPFWPRALYSWCSLGSTYDCLAHWLTSSSPAAILCRLGSFYCDEGKFGQENNFKYALQCARVTRSGRPFTLAIVLHRESSLRSSWQARRNIELVSTWEIGDLASQHCPVRGIAAIHESCWISRPCYLLEWSSYQILLAHDVEVGSPFGVRQHAACTAPRYSAIRSSRLSDRSKTWLKLLISTYELLCKSMVFDSHALQAFSPSNLSNWITT